MKHDYIRLLSLSNFGRHFLTRSYSLELLIILFEHDHIDGIEQLYEMLSSKKSKMPAFLGFLNYLQDRDCIVKFTNEDKKSQRVIALTDQCREEVGNIFNQLNFEQSAGNNSFAHVLNKSNGLNV